jgi:hypothetical protein
LEIGTKCSALRFSFQHIEKNSLRMICPNADASKFYHHSQQFNIIKVMVQEYIAVCQENSANALILFQCRNIWGRESQNEMCTAHCIKCLRFSTPEETNCQELQVSISKRYGARTVPASCHFSLSPGIGGRRPHTHTHTHTHRVSECY